ncbi:YciI family protein [Pleionea sp. CnH1-48]|uniref:YciI family protein n=1 Tax=Pleionea sp. CnH1-48 TaxID=2954494 RepID=UPI0020985CEB|nr:YciI family protein [Pleionea sp. CnH1-48]MCO7227495.1 YciI family protein [Pleionea sp. CnH1-48]
MQYMFLIYSEEAKDPMPGTDAFNKMMAGFEQLGAELAESKRLIAGEALNPVSTASTLRIRDGKTEVTDGPFAETKEVLGGLYILECENLDEALEIAAKIPVAGWGSIEVRPVMKY